MIENGTRPKVVYLIGAGASNGCVKYVGSTRGILMEDLKAPLTDKVRELFESEKEKYGSLKKLMYDVINEESTDLEQVITFLDESPSSVHKQLAGDLKRTFEKVLRNELSTIKDEIGDNRFSLYAALLDMYQVEKCPEELQAILTLNYDEFIEDAASSIEHSVDFGIQLQEHDLSHEGIKLLKLHGSFGWKDAWPIPRIDNDNEDPLWIPPGILKGKQRYPFNILWGLARELLDCDILRIIGCRLSSNDWDLISLLFTTRFIHTTRVPSFELQVIDSPSRALKLKRSYPYLEIRSLLEIKKLGIGSELAAELIGESSRTLNFNSLTFQEQENIYDVVGNKKNWFHVWLKQMAEAFAREPGVGVETPKGEFKKILDSY